MVRWTVRVVVGAVLVSACAGAGAGPIFDFRPTPGPLRYTIASEQSLFIEVPGQPQTSDQDVDASVQLEIGDARSVTASFEALSMRTEGHMGSTTLEGSDLVGKKFHGIISESGVITVSEGPETSGALADAMDPKSVFADLLVPLPPEAGAESWPVNTSMSFSASVNTTTNFDGEARFAGDTVWNGRAARVIVAEGTVRVEGSGLPEGAPAEIQMSLSGESTTRYLWDPARGVMLASTSKSSLDGIISIESMGMSFPATVTSSKTVELKQ